MFQRGGGDDRIWDTKPEFAGDASGSLGDVAIDGNLLERGE
jgi:hypothetical protein